MRERVLLSKDLSVLFGDWISETEAFVAAHNRGRCRRRARRISEIERGCRFSDAKAGIVHSSYSSIIARSLPGFSDPGRYLIIHLQSFGGGL
jgi:hypothetical protein